MAIFQPIDLSDPFPHRRRKSDRARERAGRAAYLGDRAGLLIATGTAEALMSSRAVTDHRGAAERRRLRG
jgi:hypothetical protein